MKLMHSEAHLDSGHQRVHRRDSQWNTPESPWWTCQSKTPPLSVSCRCGYTQNTPLSSSQNPDVWPY